VIVRWLCIIPILAVLLATAQAAPSPRVIGIEGDVKITLARDDYQPKPFDDRTTLILRVEAVTPSPDGKHIYDLHYMGFEPGVYRLADYLIHPDGTLATEIGDVQVEVHSILPPDYDGALNSYVPRPFPWIGGYRMLLSILAALWVLGLLAFAWFYRRRKPVLDVADTPPPPTYAERMRPFVEAAAAGTLTTSGQAQLERLMTGYWREKLALPEDQRMAESLAAMMRDPEAGSLLRAMERWLHRSGGASPAEVNTLLEPYRHSPVTAHKEAKP
jgi:hypothetical protein